MRAIRLKLAYDGTAYSGWQVQKGAQTVQGTLEDAIRSITGEQVRVLASGRTDAGVHALGQIAVFRTASRLTADIWQRALNARLPSDIAVREAEEVPPGFHPIRDSIAKRYRYLIHNSPVRSVFLQRYAWHISRTLDVAAMRSAAQFLLGRHDFAAMETSGAKRATSVRTVYDLTVTQRQPAFEENRQTLAGIAIEIEADGFLYNMVRNIVGTLVEVGRKAQPPEWVADVLASRDRRRAGPTAPAQGLWLVRVDYPQQGNEPVPENSPVCE